jgi:hypothetical protein
MQNEKDMARIFIKKGRRNAKRLKNILNPLK